MDRQKLGSIRREHMSSAQYLPEAWEWEDPNTHAAPVLTLKSPWKLDVTTVYADTVDVTGSVGYLRNFMNNYFQAYGNYDVSGAGEGRFEFYKSRGSYASPTIVQAGDALGSVYFKGYDGSAYRSAACLQATVGAAPGANDMPGKLTFQITPDGSTTLASVMALSCSGGLSLGSAYIATDAGAGNAIFAGMLLTPEVRALDAAGLYLRDDSGTLGIFVKDGGNVGIGTASPGFNLDVNAGTTNYGLRIYSDTDNAYLVIDSPSDESCGIDIGKASSVKWFINSPVSDNDLRFYANGGAGEVLWMDYATGNIGVKATSPAYTLDITGNLRCSTGFGCNGKTPQTAYATVAAAALVAGAKGMDTDANFATLYNLVVAMRAALIANGICS